MRRRRSPAQRLEGLVSEAAVGHRPVQHMQDLSKCSMARRLQQVLIGRNATSSRRKAPHRGGDNRSPTASKRSLAAPPPSFENRSSLSRVEKKIFCPPIASRRKSALHQESYRWIDHSTKDFGGAVTPPTSVGGAPTPAPPLLELLLQRPATPPHRWSSKSTSTVAGLPTPATSDTTS